MTWDTNALATAGTLTVIGPGVNTSPTNIVTSVSGSSLTLSWPPDHLGWHLQAQTNSLHTGLGTNWATVQGSDITNSFNFIVDPGNGSVFFRLVYP